MARFPALLVLRSATLLGLAASAALSIEYRSADFAFCGAESGCAALRRTPIAYLWGSGLTLPEAGLLCLALLFAVSLSKRVEWAAWLSLLGGLIGAGLLLSQAFWMKQYCWLCVTTDLSSLCAAVSGFILLRQSPAERAPAPLSLWRWALLSAVCVIAPALWPRLRPLPPLPAPILSFYQPGKINVVEFADFECPFCRELHGRLQALLAPYGDRVHFVRLNMPLEMHPHARDAALAELCARPAGKSEALAEFMFTTPDLSLKAIRGEAERLGLDLATFDRCHSDPETQARLKSEARVIMEVGLKGLPTTYVGGRRIIGAQSDDVFRSALEHAANSDDERGVPAWAYLAFIVALIAIVVRSGLTGTVGRSAPQAG